MAIDRRALVGRHDPRPTGWDAPLTVGNGRFAATLDATGTQSFPDAYAEIRPCTQSQWGWHEEPRPPELRGAVLRPDLFEVGGRTVPYRCRREGQEELYDWLRRNPHRLDLGLVGLHMTMADGRAACHDEVRPLDQALDLWQGVVRSRFAVDGHEVAVTTCCHPDQDAVAVAIELPPGLAGRVAFTLRFPGAAATWGGTGADWEHPQRHATTLTPSAHGLSCERTLDATRYVVDAAFPFPVTVARAAEHTVIATPPETATRLAAVVRFAPHPGTGPPPSFAATLAATQAHWRGFWERGGALALTAADPRARELERRVVLSQYLTAVQCSGDQPPQETGLTGNSWFGKFHLEMHLWHAAHFASWGRIDLLERSLGWYERVLPGARALAAEQGYAGARWPKMVGPAGEDTPSPIGSLLIWQQPHPILYAELCWRAAPVPATLERFAAIVTESAAFMASYLIRDGRGRVVLGPALVPVQETHRAEDTLNPTFELAYWRCGLALAQRWRERLGQARQPAWDRALAELAPLPVGDGLYLAHERCPDTWSRFVADHPSMLGAFGLLPGDGVDPATMRRTLRAAVERWRWDEAWGWDFPLAAMTAARLDEPELALDLLCMPATKNTYLANGHNRQHAKLPLYLPGNGGLLLATAMMAAGWDGAPSAPAPGFPPDWTVVHEGLRPWL